MTATPRPFVWLSRVRWSGAMTYEVSCYDHGPVTDDAELSSQSTMPLRRARQVRRQHLSDFHGRRFLWSDDERRAWEERP